LIFTKHLWIIITLCLNILINIFFKCLHTKLLVSLVSMFSSLTLQLLTSSFGVLVLKTYLVLDWSHSFFPDINWELPFCCVMFKFLYQNYEIKTFISIKMINKYTLM
jgi:hypothetical protein